MFIGWTSFRAAGSGRGGARWLATGVVAATVISGVACSPAAWARQADPAKVKVATLPIRTDGPKSLDPAKGSTQYDNMACSQIYDTLVQYKYLVRPLELEPCLIEQMPTITDNPDGTQTWRFKLRDDVFFQDDPCFPGGKGRKLVSGDVFYSWKRLADPEYELENWWILKDMIVGFDAYQEMQGAAVKAGKKFDYDAEVPGLKVISPREFEVILVRPIQQFRWKLAQFQTSVVPREAVEKYGEQFGRHPVGTGPYMVKDGDWQPAQYINYTRNPTYRHEVYPSEQSRDPQDAANDRRLGLDKPAGTRLPIIDRIECPFYVPDPPMWLDFESGKLGYTQVPSEYFDKAFLRRTRELRDNYRQKGIVSHATPLLDFIFRGFNMEDPLLGGYDDKRRKLRQALSLAFDLDAMNESFYNGTCVVYDGPIPPGLDGYPEGGESDVSYRGPDLQRAKRLLAEAGYPDGRGLPEITYYTSTGGNQAEQVQAEKRFLDALGVKLNARMVDFSELIEAINKKKAPMFGFAWGSDYPDAENNLALFYSKNKAPGANHYNYDRPEFDALYERSRTMPPGPERTRLYEQMRDMVTEDCVFIGSMARVRFYLVNPWLKNFKPSEDFNNWYKYLDVDDSKR